MRVAVPMTGALRRTKIESISNLIGQRNELANNLPTALNRIE